MNEISSGMAFWIFEIWRRMSTQLQLSYFGEWSDSIGSPAVIWHTSPISSKVSFVILDTAGQKREWKLSFGDCKFSFGVASECAVFPEFAEGKWVSYLSVELPNGKRILAAERFLDIESTPAA